MGKTQRRIKKRNIRFVSEWLSTWVTDSLESLHSNEQLWKRQMQKRRPAQRRKSLRRPQSIKQTYHILQRLENTHHTHPGLKITRYSQNMNLSMNLKAVT